MNIHYGAVIFATIAQFIFGAIWYMPIFGKLWGKIHDFDKQPAATQAEMRKQMWPYLVLEFVTTFVTTWVLALFSKSFTGTWNLYGLAGWAWIGFIVPTQIAAVVFGGTRPGWILKKILVMTGAALGCMMIAAYFLSTF